MCKSEELDQWALPLEGMSEDYIQGVVDLADFLLLNAPENEQLKHNLAEIIETARWLKNKRLKEAFGLKD